MPRRNSNKPTLDETRSVTEFSFRGGEFAVVSIPLRPHLPSQLTAAEREVVALLYEGMTNAAIAKARGVSVRTVANQVASVMKKMRVGSRAALIAMLSRRSG